MLFGVKRNAATAALTTLLLLALAAPLYLASSIAVTPGLEFSRLARAAAGFGVILLSDALLHAGFTALAPRRYPPAFDELLDYFAGQSTLAMATGGLLAASEEILFRGGLMPAFIGLGNLNPHTAAAATGLLFGALHLIPRRRLAPIAIWACWEGFLLGEVYLWSGSLLGVIVVHAVHDFGGFAAFRWLRRRRMG